MKSDYWILSCGILLSLGSTPSEADCVTSGRDPGDVIGYDKIFINTSSLPGSFKSYVNSAANQWNDADCNHPIPNAQYAFEFPTLSVDYAQGSGRTVNIIYASGFNPDNEESCGNFAGNTITLFAVTATATWIQGTKTSVDCCSGTTPTTTAGLSGRSWFL